jgi:hypothetical protein
MHHKNHKALAAWTADNKGENRITYLKWAIICGARHDIIRFYHNSKKRFCGALTV